MKIWGCAATRVTQRYRFYHSPLNYFLSSHWRALWNHCCVVGLLTSRRGRCHWWWHWILALPLLSTSSPTTYSHTGASVLQPTLPPPPSPKAQGSANRASRAGGWEPSGHAGSDGLSWAIGWTPALTATSYSLGAGGSWEIQISIHRGRARPPGYGHGSGLCDASSTPASGREPRLRSVWAKIDEGSIPACSVEQQLQWVNYLVVMHILWIFLRCLGVHKLNSC